MDPNTAWTEFLELVAKHDYTEARAVLRDLLDWLEFGGFPPDALRGNIGATPKAVIFGLYRAL